MRVRERSRRVRYGNAASVATSESETQLARKSTETHMPAESRVTVPPDSAIQSTRSAATSNPALNKTISASRMSASAAPGRKSGIAVECDSASRQARLELCRTFLRHQRVIKIQYLQARHRFEILHARIRDLRHVQIQLLEPRQCLERFNRFVAHVRVIQVEH